MLKGVWIVPVLFLCLLTVCKQEVHAAEKAYEEGEVLIAVKRNETPSVYDKRNKKSESFMETSGYNRSICSDVEYVSSIPCKGDRYSGDVKKQSQNSSLMDVYVAKLQENVTVEAAVCQLNRDEKIYLAEPNYRCQVFDVRHPYKEDEMVEQEQWYLQSLAVVPVWQNMEENQLHPGEGVTVAVIDTGVSLLHEDLIENISVNQIEAEGKEGVDDDGNGYIDDINGANLVNSYTEMTDSTGHGTRMAGLIAMTAGNGGGAGVAYAARILPVKVSTDGNFAIDKAIEGISYAIDNGADIINMSFGTYHESEIFRMMIENAAQKSVLVAAAGNDSLANGKVGSNIYPASYSSVLGVMSMDEDGRLSDFSNWDTGQDQEEAYELIAPGRNIWSTSLRNSYKISSGTSASSAMTAGVLAVYRSLFPEKEKYGATFLRESFLASMKHTMLAHTSDGAQYEYAITNLADAASQVEELKNSDLSQTPLPSGTPIPNTPKPGELPIVKFPEPTAKPEEKGDEKTNVMAVGKKLSSSPKKIQGKKPIIKVQYLKKGRARLIFKIKGYSNETGYYVYVSKSKRKGYRKLKRIGKNKMIVSSKKKRYYRVVAYRSIEGKPYKSKKSEAVKCFHL